MMATLQQIIQIVRPDWSYPLEDDKDLFEGISVDKLSFNSKGLVADGVEIVCENPRLAFARVLSTYSFVACKVIEGLNVKVHATATIGNHGFGYVRDNNNELIHIKHFGNVEIHDNVTIGEYVNIHRGVIQNTVIGAGTKIDFGCHVAHNVVIGKNNSFAAHCIIEGSCVIGDNNTFGTNVVVLRKVKIGSGCTIGSGAVVTKDVPDGETWIGNPARKLEKSKFQQRMSEHGIPNAKEVPMPIKDFINNAHDDLGR